MLRLVLDPLFTTPLLTGLCCALLLSVLGCWLRVREEWLAALGLAHVAAAGALLGLAAQLPAPLASASGALLAALGKAVAGLRGNSGYGLMILAGWSLTLLLAANTALGEELAHALIDGQLYFVADWQLRAMAATTLLSLALLPWLNRRLLRAQLLPEGDRANARPAWRWHGAFDLLSAAALALATGSVGLMAAFALVFIPAWLAFVLAPGWRAALLLSPALGVGAYLLAFVLALGADQPFGPTLVACLLVLSTAVLGLRELLYRVTRSRR
ncbi:metal ABC transporter permease [Alkalilimnicola sp. S0819]|uniref:metal ABC transporter permease n=1 Tax=Alkalilimnicola sp. S0819 TaxID=2613922 RepID=UPI0012616648|nr:metal ABC transporter permease [Alkalilimnicola sp. S0819]KAB7627224.1 ABC transporter [Alkalilimnicola sp. S0819]MPQ15937.1 ABC transporter [Alkalilimnicola sp. S0819]